MEARASLADALHWLSNQAKASTAEGKGKRAAYHTLENVDMTLHYFVMILKLYVRLNIGNLRKLTLSANNHDEVESVGELVGLLRILPVDFVEFNRGSSVSTDLLTALRLNPCQPRVSFHGQYIITAEHLRLLPANTELAYCGLSDTAKALGAMRSNATLKSLRVENCDSRIHNAISALPNLHTLIFG